MNKELWQKHVEYEAHLFDIENLNLYEKERITKDLVLGLIDEATELLNEINWKHQYKSKKKVDEEKFLEELVDVYLFWQAISIVWKIKPEQIIKVAKKKIEKNTTRLFK